MDKDKLTAVENRATEIEERLHDLVDNEIDPVTALALATVISRLMVRRVRTRGGNPEAIELRADLNEGLNMIHAFMLTDGLLQLKK